MQDLENCLNQWEANLSFEVVEAFEQRREDFNTLLSLSQKRPHDRETQKRLAKLTSRWNCVENQLRDVAEEKRETELNAALQTKKLFDDTALWIDQGQKMEPGLLLVEIEQRISLLKNHTTDDPVLLRLIAYRKEKLSEYGENLDGLIHSVEEQLLVDRMLGLESEEYLQKLINLNSLLRSHESHVRRLAEDGAEEWMHRRACVGDLTGMAQAHIDRLSKGLEKLQSTRYEISTVRSILSKAGAIKEAEEALARLQKPKVELTNIAEKSLLDDIDRQINELDNGVKFAKRANELFMWTDSLEQALASPLEVVDTSQLTKAKSACQQNKDRFVAETSAVIEAGSSLPIDLEIYIHKISDK